MLPIVRPGLATIAVWALVNVWGNFLTSYILLRDPDKSPAAVRDVHLLHRGRAGRICALISAFSLLSTRSRWWSLYLFVNRRYGFRFHGGIKS